MQPCERPNPGSTGTVGVPTLACFSQRWLNQVAHALVGAVSRVVSTPWWHTDTLSEPSVGMSADAARTSACATPSPPNVCEKCRLEAVKNRWQAKAPAPQKHKLLRTKRGRFRLSTRRSQRLLG